MIRDVSSTSPRLGRKMITQGESPGKDVPHPLVYPSPRPAEEGVGGATLRTHGSRRGLNSAAPDGAAKRRS